MLVAKTKPIMYGISVKKVLLGREDDMLEHMRKSSPNVFYKYFKKKQPKQTMIINDTFFEHFF